ncbi:MAG: hypothetical protein ACTS9Y_00440 [Methylophilus sp.]|uniref:hypothetical protein n=1 Tax=Methylophilus sp. TaxID=29541 RepID=UPI003F9ECBC7
MLKLKHQVVRLATVLWVTYCLAVLFSAAVSFLHPEAQGEVINWIWSMRESESGLGVAVFLICIAWVFGTITFSAAVYNRYGRSRETFKSIFVIFLVALAIVGNFVMLVKSHDLAHYLEMTLAWTGFIALIWYTTKKMLETVENSYAKISFEYLINGDIAGYINRKNAAL